MRSEYEWAQHLKMARKAGVSEAQIAALASWKASAEFDAKEKAALALAEAVTPGRVTDEVHAEVMRHFDHQDYVELVRHRGVLRHGRRACSTRCACSSSRISATTRPSCPA